MALLPNMVLLINPRHLPAAPANSPAPIMSLSRIAPGIHHALTMHTWHPSASGQRCNQIHIDSLVTGICKPGVNLTHNFKQIQQDLLGPVQPCASQCSRL